MENFTPVSGFVGGLLIGGAAALLILANGRVAGISGILGGALDGAPDRLWRGLFLIGLVVGPLAALALGFGPSAITVTGSTPLLIVGGLLVGIGTRIGGGCTSGHGVCGLARLSRRSLAATATFMIFGALTVFVARHLVGGV
jgi:uncharacterized membrane protein YedE/YeeE